MLRREVERMARESRLPGRLAELFAALDLALSEAITWRSSGSSIRAASNWLHPMRLGGHRGILSETLEPNQENTAVSIRAVPKSSENGR